jgi:hypothetical protein
MPVYDLGDIRELCSPLPMRSAGRSAWHRPPDARSVSAWRPSTSAHDPVRTKLRVRWEPGGKSPSRQAPRRWERARDNYCQDHIGCPRHRTGASGSRPRRHAHDPEGIGSLASRTTMMTGSTVLLAARRLQHGLDDEGEGEPIGPLRDGRQRRSLTTPAQRWTKLIRSSASFACSATSSPRMSAT